MEAKYIERLEQVVRVLTELPPEKKFNLATWMKCGTVGCAVGWAALDPWFRRRGLKVVPNHDHDEYDLWFNLYHDLQAAEVFFGLSLSEVAHLFLNRSYGRGSRYDVIRRLKAFIRQEREVT